MESQNEMMLFEGAKNFGISLDRPSINRFDRFLGELLKWNQKMNLTAIRTERGVILKHFIDSLSVYRYLDDLRSLFDLGSGAGFPGIPLKIVQPSFEITSIDSVQKKIDFQRHIIRVLGLEGIHAIHGRVQMNKIPEELTGRFDAVLSRAFSDISTFLSLSHPFLRRGGVAIAMKGEIVEDEDDLRLKARGLQYRLMKWERFLLPFSTFKRSVLLFEKT